MKNLPWFSKIPKFEKQIKKKIEDGHVVAYELFTIRLTEVSNRIKDVVSQMHSWGRLMSDIQTFVNHLEIEFEQWDSKLFFTIKNEMVVEMNEKRLKKVKSTSFTDTEVKDKRKTNADRVKLLHQLEDMKGAKYEVEKCLYTPALKAIRAVEAQSRFTVAYENNFKNIA